MKVRDRRVDGFTRFKFLNDFERRVFRTQLVRHSVANCAALYIHRHDDEGHHGQCHNPFHEDVASDFLSGESFEETSMIIA